MILWTCTGFITQPLRAAEPQVRKYRACLVDTSKMSPIKEFRLIYEPLNEENLFSEGDAVKGTVIVTLSKETKVKSIFVKVKGDARVNWSKQSGGVEVVFKHHTRFFKDKEYLVKEDAGVEVLPIFTSFAGTLLPKGVHRFKFGLQIPQGDMPSSFKGTYGKIVYMLEAKLSRSWKCPVTVETKLSFVSKSLSFRGKIVCPRSESVQKEIGVFSPGQIRMMAIVDRPVCSPGDTVSVVAKIYNSSSKKMKPKVSLQQDIVYPAKETKMTCNSRLWQIVGDTIEQNTEETFSCKVKIPANVFYTIHNCNIISVQYHLKVYLDISFAVDPSVILPLVIVPRSFAALSPADLLQLLLD
ncbi:Arrestin domain-containing protein 3 [Collichthys lucidus]|uniref:Arrestin domain-containing protein 3 n=1 Tax=Collichthys lucidus TaxID=240159 RepID=A0A4U5UYE0_COLLU|nr:Arrestin domain-containing protein 3 [Collichthys lucidus]